ncbi:uncharacterized protein AB9W97_018096 [Spinachia spinachia]
MLGRYPAQNLLDTEDSAERQLVFWSGFTFSVKENISGERLHTSDSMTSVNSPACLLARNHFYKNSAPGHEEIKPVVEVFSCQNHCVAHNPRQFTLWVTMATPPGFPGGIGNKEVWVNVVLSTSVHFSPSKPTSPADRSVK